MRTKMQSGPTPPALMWRNAGWASTTATLLPPASTLPPPTSATVREDTQETAHCTATRRESLHLNVHSSAGSSFSCIQDKTFHPTGATMSVVRASAAAARGLSVNVPLAGRPTPPLWSSVVLNVMWTVVVTSIPPVLLLQESVMNARVRPLPNPSLVLVTSCVLAVLKLIQPKPKLDKTCSSDILPSSLDWTTGPHCEHCRPGSFGSALAGGGGCVPCECNGHGDPLRGYCHNQTGQCYCTHNTQGPHCESCLPGYYGDPR